MAYIELFLARQALKWFELYLIKYKVNRLLTGYNKVRYMFLSWEGFCNRLKQIYGDLEVTVIAKYKL